MSTTPTYKTFIAARAPRPSFLGGPVLLEEPHAVYLRTPASATLTPTPALARLPLPLSPLKRASLAPLRLKPSTPPVYITALALPRAADSPIPVLTRADLIYAHNTLAASLHSLTAASARLEAALPLAVGFADPVALLDLLRSLDKAAHTTRRRLELVRDAMGFLALCEAEGALPRWAFDSPTSTTSPASGSKGKGNTNDKVQQTTDSLTARLTADAGEMPGATAALELAYALRPDAPADAQTVTGAILADQAQWLARSLSERAGSGKNWAGKIGKKFGNGGFFFTWDRAMSFDSRSSTSSEGGL